MVSRSVKASRSTATERGRQRAARSPTCVEYAWALIQIGRTALRLSRRCHFDVIHVCNPPDVLSVATLPMKLRGSALIFDHHDLVPELYLSRFGGKKGAFYWLTIALERLAFALADVAIATNDSYRRVALSRGRKQPEDVFVVRNDPDLNRFRPREPDPALRRGKPLLIAYAGVMGPQDGVDQAIRALALLRDRRDDWHAAFAGDGDVVEEMRSLADDLGLAHSVEFLGWLRDDQLLSLLSTADVCLAPEPRNPLNEVSTMVKVLEYMAMARPIVSYDLAESLVSAGDSALFAPSGDVRVVRRMHRATLGRPGAAQPALPERPRARRAAVLVDGNRKSPCSQPTIARAPSVEGVAHLERTRRNWSFAQRNPSVHPLRSETCAESVGSSEPGRPEPSSCRVGLSTT